MLNVKIMRSLQIHIFLWLALLPGIAAAQQDAAPKLVPALGWDTATQGCFTTCVTLDAQNAVWVGTEGKGLWRYTPREKKWTQFTTRWRWTSWAASGPAISTTA
jgi:ligand-binding sensor domain-containing protein